MNFLHPNKELIHNSGLYSLTCLKPTAFATIVATVSVELNFNIRLLQCHALGQMELDVLDC